MAQFKIGVCEFSFPCRGPIAIGMAGKAGFDGVQIADCMGSDEGYPLANPYVQDCYMKASEEHKVELQAMHLQRLQNQGFLKKSPESPEGQIARESLRTAALACHQMGIKTMMCTVIRVMNREEYEYVVEHMKYGVEECAKYGITFAQENDFTSEYFHRMRQDVGDGLKLCFDTMNVVVNGIGNPEDELDRFGLDCIDHFHVKDCVENEAGYMTKYTTPFRLIGEGHTHVKEWADRVKQTDFCGWVMSENFYFDKVYGGADFIELAARDAKRMHEVLD